MSKTRPVSTSKTLQLYVWTEFCPDYYYGLAFAIAESEEEAKQMVVDEMGWGLEGISWGTLSVHNVNEKTAGAISGGG